MPRGSKIGERRGGRQRGTPNRRTILVGRILATACERPAKSAAQFIDVLVKDEALPADIRMAIVQRLSPAGRSRSVESRAARTSADPRRGAKRANPLREPSGTAKFATLDVIFSIAQDTSAAPEHRRKAASEAAAYLLPKMPGMKRWWVNARPDEYGFAITAQIAAEYRDIKIELRRLASSESNSTARMRKAAKMRERLKEILHRLACPAPLQYGRDQFAKDGCRLIVFLRKREAGLILSEEEDAEEAHCRARYDCYDEGPENAARRRLVVLKERERKFRIAFGRRLTPKEQVELRLLRLLYSENARGPNPYDEPGYQPLRDEPMAADGNLYPPNSTLAPLKDGEIEEFVDVPPYVIGHPGYPGHRWLRELPLKPIDDVVK